MYSACTDHESALDLWQCREGLEGWGGGEDLGFIERPFWGLWLLQNEPCFHASDIENNPIHLGWRSWASRHYCNGMGASPTCSLCWHGHRLRKGWRTKEFTSTADILQAKSYRNHFVVISLLFVLAMVFLPGYFMMLTGIMSVASSFPWLNHVYFYCSR